MKAIPIMQFDKPAYFVTHKGSVQAPVFRQRSKDTAKNLVYAEKRRKLGEKMTAKLGVTCWG